MEGVGRDPGEPSPQIVRVHPGTGLDRRDGGTNRPSVLAHSCTLRNSLQRDLMSRWNVLEYDEGALANPGPLTAHEADRRNGNVIQWIKAQHARQGAGIVVAHRVSGQLQRRPIVAAG